MCTAFNLRAARSSRDSRNEFRVSERAFTLIEIMVVVAIMGIILAAGIPSLYGFLHKAGLRKTTSDIVETCQSARSVAILGGSPTELVFHPREGTEIGRAHV